MLQKLYMKLGSLCFMLNIIFFSSLSCRYFIDIPYNISERSSLCIIFCRIILPYMAAFLLFYGTRAIVRGNREAWFPLVVGFIPTVLNMHLYFRIVI